MSNRLKERDLAVAKSDLLHTSPRLFAPDTPPLMYGDAMLYPARCEELTLLLYDAHANRSGAYALNNVDTSPQAMNVPGQVHQPRLFDKKYPRPVERGSLEHLVELFFATLTDRRQVSIGVYPAHVELYDQYPEIYTPAVIDVDPVWLGELLGSYQVGVPNQSGRYWVRCAKTLFEEFNGDPRILFDECGWTVEGVMQFKKQKRNADGTSRLPGYGPKITSLCFLFYTELGVCHMPEDAYPVDMHVQRITKQFGALMHPGADLINAHAEDMLRNLLCIISKHHGLDKVQSSHSYWQLGRSSCTECYRKRGNEIGCPIAQECTGAFDSHPYFKKGKWLADETPMRKAFHRIFRLEPVPADSPQQPLFTGE